MLDWRAGSEPDDEIAEGEGWRTWVDEVVVSWAACLLADPLLAAPRGRRGDRRDARRRRDRPRPHPRRPGPTAAQRVPPAHAPDARDREAAVLLRHPDLLDPVAALHRDDLLYLLDARGCAAGRTRTARRPA